MKNNITYIGLSFITSILFLTGFISVLPINITEQGRSLAIIFILPYFISFVSYGTLGLLQCIKKLNLSSLVAVISGLIVATGIPLLLAVFNITNFVILCIAFQASVDGCRFRLTRVDPVTPERTEQKHKNSLCSTVLSTAPQSEFSIISVQYTTIFKCQTKYAHFFLCIQAQHLSVRS